MGVADTMKPTILIALAILAALALGIFIGYGWGVQSKQEPLYSAAIQLKELGLEVYERCMQSFESARQTLIFQGDYIKPLEK